MYVCLYAHPSYDEMELIEMPLGDAHASAQAPTSSDLQS